MLSSNANHYSVSLLLRRISRHTTTENQTAGGMKMLLWMAMMLVMALAATTATENEPKHFRYFQIYASEDGTTHFKKCNMHGFILKPYALVPQFVRSDFGGEPLQLVFTELSVGLEQPLHSPPQVQFVVTLSGSWYVKTSDGTKYVFKKGDVLFQDNTKNSPADKQPKHISGVVGDEPCQQMVVQISRPPQVDNPCPFS